jgi:hypothetical protein
VRIVHAPRNVAAVVAQWLVQEPRCGSPLEVRVVPSREGLYVFARDAGGHVRERTVPDAQSAGVLIASWAAADAERPGEMVVELSYTRREEAPVAPLGDMVVELSYTPAPQQDTASTWFARIRQRLDELIRVRGAR